MPSSNTQAKHSLEGFSWSAGISGRRLPRVHRSSRVADTANGTTGFHALINLEKHEEKKGCYRKLQYDLQRAT